MKWQRAARSFHEGCFWRSRAEARALPPRWLAGRARSPSGHGAKPTCLLRILPAKAALTALICPSKTHLILLSFSFSCYILPAIQGKDGEGRCCWGRRPLNVFPHGRFSQFQARKNKNKTSLHSLHCPKKFHITLGSEQFIFTWRTGIERPFPFIKPHPMPQCTGATVMMTDNSSSHFGVRVSRKTHPQNLKKQMATLAPTLFSPEFHTLINNLSIFILQINSHALVP